MPTNFIGVLLTTTPNYTVNTGFVSQLYDARGAQTITVQSGASLDLVGALGANTFNLHGNASEWQAWRDGSTVILGHSNGDRVNLPAQLDAQKIIFADLQTNIRIDTSTGSAQVKMGGMVLESSPTTITANALSSGNPNSSQKAPWSLVMNASVGTKSGGYTPALLVSDGSADGTANQAIDQAFNNVVISPDATKANFTVSQGGGNVKLNLIADGTVSALGDIDMTARPISMGDKVFYLAQSQDASAKASAVTDWNTNQTKFSNVMGVQDQAYDIDSLNQSIWVSKYFAPYGNELVKLSVNSDGNLSATMVKDIASGTSSGISYSKSGTGQVDGASLPDGRFVFAANNGTSGTEPWISDGTDAGTVLLRDLYSSSSKNGSTNSDPNRFVTLGDKVVFVANVNKMADNTLSEIGQELVITDGTTSGTVVYDLAAGSASSYPQIIGQLNGYLYFSTQTAIYRTNGGQPEKLTDWTYSGASILGYSDQKAYLTKIDEARGYELWVADLSTRTVSLVKDILPGTGSSFAGHSYTVRFMVGDKFVFTAYKSATEVSLFVTDGTEAKTFEIVTANILQIQALTNDVVVYRTSTGLYSFQIGNSAPSVVTLSDVALTQSFQKDKDQIFYQITGGSLYATGGSLASTVKLADKVLQYKVIADDAIYFTQTNTNTTNVALWFSDGTAAGTRFIEDLPTGNYDISNAFGLRTAGTPLPNDTVAPTLVAALVNGTTVTLKFKEDNALDALHVPTSNPFTISGTDATITTFAVDASAKTVTLTLSKSVLSSDVVKVSYLDPSAGNDVTAIQDAAGNDLVSFTNRAAINQTADNVPPLFSRAEVNGNLLTLTYTDASLLDAINVPVASRFTVGGTTATVASVVVNASSKTVTLTLSAAVKSTDTITVSYSASSTNNDTASLQDTNGFDAVSLVNAEVTNQTLVEEVKAPWTLLVHTASTIYASDATKIGSGFMTLPDSSYFYDARDFLVTGTNKVAVIVVNSYDSNLQQNTSKAYALDGALNAPKLLATGFDYYGGVFYVGDKIVQTDSYDRTLKGFVTDGTVSGTKIIADLPEGIVDLNTETIWSSYYSRPYGDELFKTVLTEANPVTSLVKDISSGTSSGLNGLEGALLPNGKLVFRGSNTLYGGEPWVSDGTEDGTFPFDLYSNSSSKSGGGSWPTSFITFQGKVVFSANVNGWIKEGQAINTGQELVFTDGTLAGTYVLDVNPGANSSSPQIISEANGLIYFTASNSTKRALYSTNGITFTYLADVYESPLTLASDANRIFFRASDESKGTELWVADTSANTFSLVKDILPGSGSSLPISPGKLIINGKLIFRAYTSATERSLFVSDGTSSGTFKVGNDVTSYAALGSTLIFVDGNVISAVNLVEINSASLEILNASSPVTKFESDADQVFIRLSNGDFYATKGTTTTTVKLASSVKNFKMVAENALYFVVANTQSTTGYDLWYSDGTSAGTRYVEEVSSSIYSALDTAVAIRTPGTDAPNDNISPIVSSAVVSGTSLTITFNDHNGLDATNKPASSAFNLSGTDATISSVAVDATNKTVTLTLSRSVLSSDSINVSYVDPSSGNDIAAIQDEAGNDAASFTNRYVINQTADNVPPLFSKAEVNGNKLTLIYTDASLLDAINIPAANNFTVGGTTATVSSVAVNSANKTVTLTLSAALKSTDIVTVSYTDPTPNNDDSAIQDANGYDAVSFSNVAVTNLTPFEEVKAPWTLLARTPSSIYASDATKSGSDSVTLPNVSSISSTRDFTVVTSNKAAVFSAYVFDTVAQKYVYQAYSIKGSTLTPSLLASDIDYYGTVVSVGNKIVQTDSNDSSQNGYVTDGTVSGTKLIADLPNGIIDSNTLSIWSEIRSTPYGQELFKLSLSDPQPSYQMVKDMFSGTSSGLYGLEGALLPNGKLVFGGYNNQSNKELWISDGTDSGTFELDLFPGNYGSSHPTSFTTYGNKVAFTAYAYGWVKNSQTYDVGGELFFTDGTLAGTRVLDIYPGYESSYPEIIGEANGLLYFTATAASGRGFYSTNGTTFFRLADVNSSATRLAWNTNKAFFSVSDASNGAELWVADFTANTFTLVKDILMGSGSGLSGDVGAFMVGDKLVFKAYTSATQQNLFVSNGTSAGTVQIGSSLGAYAALGETLVFADGGSINAANLSGTTPVKVELVNASSVVVKMQSDSDQAYFSLANGDLYATKGEASNTLKLASAVKNFKVVADNALYFVVSNNLSTTGYDLWYSDGTSSGTRYVEEVSSSIYSALDTAVAIRTPGTAAPNDIASPALSAAVINGSNLILTFKDDNALDAINKPAASAFSLNGTEATISSVSLDATNKTVTLSLSKAVLSSDVIKVSYADLTSSNDTVAIQDEAGNDAASFTNRYVINQTADNVPPLFIRAEVNGNKLTLIYTDASLLDAINIPADNNFTVGGTTATVSSVAVNSANKTVTLTLSAALKSTDTVTVSYADPTPNNDDSAIQDANGYDAVSFSNAAVTNLTPLEEVKAPWTLLLIGYGDKLYASDGTKSGSSILASYSYGSSSNKIVVNNNKNYALLINYVGYDYKLQQSILNVSSINGSSQAPELLGSGVSEFAKILNVGDKIVITDTFNSDYKALITDGTVSGTISLPDLPEGIIDSNAQTIWASYYTAPYGTELFKISLTDSSPALTLVKDINPDSSAFSDLDGAIFSNGKLIFRANTSEIGSEPWFSDGNSAGTTFIDLYPGANSSYPGDFTRFANKVVFSATVSNWVKDTDSISVGRELVVTDGTVSGTNILDISPGINSSNPVIYGEIDGLLYFAAHSTGGLGFYATNGITFTKLGDINSSANWLVWNKSKAFFTSSDSANGGELWMADFSAKTSSLVKDILPGPGSALSGDVGAFMVNGKLVFKAYTSPTQQNLFVSDGTSNGTVQIGNTIGSYAAIGDTLVFSDGNSISAANLSGATPSKVELVNVSSDVVKMQSDTDQAFFSLANGDLYATNGTLNTTAKLASSVNNFKVVADNAIYLVTTNTQSPTGYDLWYSDGTVAGTRFVEDVPADVYSYLDNAVVIQTVGVNV